MIVLRSIAFQNIANVITTIGIVLTAWLNVLLWKKPLLNNSFDQQLIFILVVGITFSDLLDGWIARKLEITSSVGEFLDKVRDKLYSCSIFLYFFVNLLKSDGGASLSLVKGLIVIALITESFLILIWIQGFLCGLDTSSHNLGRIKTTFYFIAIGWWFFIVLIKDITGEYFENILYSGLILFLLVSSVYGILSVSTYLERYNDFIEKKRGNN